MNTYKINFKWKENNGAVYQNIQHDYEIRKDCKTPAEAARQFSQEWTSKNNGYIIISIDRTFGQTGPVTFIPKKHAKKNWG